MSTLVEKLDAKLDSLDSAQELAQEVAGHVSSLPLSSGTPAAHSSDLSDLLSKLLYATIATQQPSLQDSARFIESIFESLPGPSEPDSELQASSRASQVADQPPKNHKELLQFAICDILWALDSSFEAAPSSEPWPAPRDAKVSLQELSPHRYALRGLLALLRTQLPLPLQKLRVALQVATDPATEGRIAQGEIRARTTMFYKQQKYNLMREESEGYSKLVAELMADMGPAHDAATGLPVESPSVRKSRALQTMERIQALIGHFDLDPTRTLDIILDIFSDNIVHHHAFFRELLRVSPWGRSAALNKESHASASGDVDMTDASGSNGARAESDGSLKEGEGDFICAQVLGFKFSIYQAPEVVVDVPEKLYLLAAVLIWDGFVKLSDLYPHLSPDDSAVSALASKFSSDLAAKAREGSVNALTMAASLDSSDLPRQGSSSSAAAEKSAAAKSKPKEMPNQKVGLLKALLGIGEMDSAMFLFSKFAFLSGPFPDIADLTLRITKECLKPAFAPHSKASRHLNSDEGEQQDLGFGGMKQRYSTTEHRLVEPPPLRCVLTGRACPATLPGTDLVYFFAEWRDRLPVNAESSPEHSLAVVVRLLRFVGPYLSRDLLLLHQLLTIGVSAVSNASDSDETARTLWSEILRTHILPALTISEPNPGLSVALWSLLGQFPLPVRYSFYGEWKERAPKMYPHVRLRRAEAERETKSLLRRIGSDAAHNKRFPRQFAKIAHRDPLTIFAVSLSQVQSYENLIMPVVEAARYLTPFEYDVLSYSMLEALSDPARQRIKEDGLHNSLWLQGLSTFVASLHKKWPFDVSLILQYLLKQLAASNTTDLLLLRDIFKHMAGVEVVSPADLAESGIAALSGGKTLRTEFSTPTNIQKLRVSRKAALKPQARLHNALITLRYATPLLVRIAKARETALFSAEEDEAQVLRVLGNMYDQITTTLNQMHDYFTLLSTQADYERVVPSLEELWKTYEVEAPVAFAFFRPRVSKILRENQQPVEEGSPWSPVLKEAVSLAEEKLTEAFRQTINPGFFVTFWTLELYDIFCPQKLYDSLRGRVDLLSKELPSDLTSSERERFPLQLRELSLTLDKEKQSQIAAQSVTRARLEKEAPHWIVADNRANVIHCFITKMIVPRARLSPADALFCAKFVRLLHELGTPNFPTLFFYDRLFGDQLLPICFHMTEDEVRNYARFLAETLSTLSAWYKNEKLYEAEAIGNFKPSEEGGPAQNLRPGFVQRGGALANLANATRSDFLSHLDFKKAFIKWQRNICISLRNCIESREYMSIRNGLLLLIPLADYVPFEQRTGSTLLTVVKTLSMRENGEGGREDLKILTKGYEAILSKKSRSWELPASAPVKPTKGPKPSLPVRAEQVSEQAKAEVASGASTPKATVEADSSRVESAQQDQKATSEPSPPTESATIVTEDKSDSTAAIAVPKRPESAQSRMSSTQTEAPTSSNKPPTLAETGRSMSSNARLSDSVRPRDVEGGSSPVVKHPLPQRPNIPARPVSPEPPVRTWGRPASPVRRTATPSSNGYPARSTGQPENTEAAPLGHREADNKERPRGNRREDAMEPPPVPPRESRSRPVSSRHGSPDSLTSRSDKGERDHRDIRESNRERDRRHRELRESGKERERLQGRSRHREGDPSREDRRERERNERHRDRDSARGDRDRDRDRRDREDISSKRRRVDEPSPRDAPPRNLPDRSQPPPPGGPREPPHGSLPGNGARSQREVGSAPPRGPRAEASDLDRQGTRTSERALQEPPPRPNRDARPADLEDVSSERHRSAAAAAAAPSMSIRGAAKSRGMFDNAVSHLARANEKTSRGRGRNSNGQEIDSATPSPLPSATSERSKDSRTSERDDRGSAKRKHDSNDQRGSEGADRLLSRVGAGEEPEQKRPRPDRDDRHDRRQQSRRRNDRYP